MLVDYRYYKSLLFTYDPNDGTYSLHDNLTGRVIGFCGLVDGPGWVYNPVSLAGLMQDELASIAHFIDDLNATLKEDRLDQVPSTIGQRPQ